MPAIIALFIAMSVITLAVSASDACKRKEEERKWRAIHGMRRLRF